MFRDIYSLVGVIKYKETFSSILKKKTTNSIY